MCQYTGCCMFETVRSVRDLYSALLLIGQCNIYLAEELDS
uniref:Uncharacterized protein n=1 Tax=Arundo donax TaxID=35708 RepID=A0A0A9HP20_ARUDO